MVSLPTHQPSSHVLSTRVTCSAGRLRAAVGRELGARNTPRLEFRQDQPSREQALLERVFEQMDRERREQEEQQHAEEEQEEEAEQQEEQQEEDRRLKH